MDLNIDALISAAKNDFFSAPTRVALEDAKSKYLGKSGQLTLLLKGLSKLPVDERKLKGAEINRAKSAIEDLLNSARKILLENELLDQLQSESIDITLPGRVRHGTGGLHPISRSIGRIESIFRSIGFDVADGPEIETDWYSFTALNNPENHPARSMQDTFYVDVNDENNRPLCLRPHTSPMQVRYARNWATRCQNNAELKVIAPGRTYRVDNDATHSPMFHQCEGLWLGKDISFKDLKYVLTNFFKEFFEADDLSLRFRPSYFPFTQPSAEVDIAFMAGPHKGKWLEVAGAGQVHPSVIKNFNMDPEEVIGFAFGIGPDRLTMLRYGIDDLRMFFDGDIRFIKQFQ